MKLGSVIMITNYKKSKSIVAMEEDTGVELHQLLRSLYVDRNMDIKDIATLLDVNRLTISRWLRKCGIYSHRLEAK